MPDYAAMKREYPKLKAALTRAVRSGNHQKIIDTVEHAMGRFDIIGYPDGWNRWENARQDAIWARNRAGADLYPLSF